MNDAAPVPVWSEAPRYAPSVPFPPYAYIPGSAAHPRTVDAPHLPFDVEREAASRPALAFAYGVDLYHAGYVWEAHEAWEALWHRAREASPLEADAVQCLILTSAAVVKYREGSAEGAMRLLRKAADRAERAVAGGAPFPEWIDGRALSAAIARATGSLEANPSAPAWPCLAKPSP